jgi:hypothetical protein
MGANPFDEVVASIDTLRMELRIGVRNMATAMEALRNGLNMAAVMAKIDALGESPAEWETLADACSTRHKARAQLLAAVKDGTVKAQSVACAGGRGKWLLSVADLDKHFPKHGGGRGKKKPRPQRLGFSEPHGSSPENPMSGNRTLATVPELFA